VCLAACGGGNGASQDARAHISASSTLQDFGPGGVLSANQPGWHSQKPPKFPEWVQLDFNQKQSFTKLSLLPQDGFPDRGPKRLQIQVSDDGKTWTTAGTIDNACGEVNRWKSLDVGKTVDTTHVRLLIESNCGSQELLTFRGLRFE
jgi:hypothetical protein